MNEARLQIWSKVEEKRGTILALRGGEVYRIAVKGGKARREVPRMVEALQQGQAPASLGASSVESLALDSIAKAEVAPGQGQVKFTAGGEGGSSLSFSTGNSNAGEIARSVLAGSGRPFREGREDLGVVEALIQPVVTGAIIGFFWFLIYKATEQLEAGEAVDVSGRRGGMKRLMVWVGETLGTTGLLAIGALLLALIIAWAANRIVRRPQRTTWQLDGAA